MWKEIPFKDTPFGKSITDMLDKRNNEQLKRMEDLNAETQQLVDGLKFTLDTFKENHVCPDCGLKVRQVYITKGPDTSPEEDYTAKFVFVDKDNAGCQRKHCKHKSENK